METEIWKDVLGYEGLYQVSNMGNVKSMGNGNSNNSKKRLLKPQKSKKYLKVILYKNGIYKNYFVHKIEWEAFYGIVPDGYEINHIDENPENNCLDNLSLVTHRENINWGTRNERSAKTRTNHPKVSKQVIQYDLNGNVVSEYPSVHEVERQFSFSRGNISACCNGRLKQTYGYIWKYKEVS